MFPPAAPAVPQEPPTVERSIDLIINKADTTADEAVRQSMRERLKLLRARIDAGLAATAASGDPAAPPAAAPDAASVSGLLSGDAAVRRHTSDAITAKRKEVVSALVDLIRDAGNLQDRPESVAAAVRLLGELRAAEGVEAIVGVMKHRANSNGSVTRLPGFWWDKPLEGTPEYALIQIGEPCVPALIETLASSDEIRGGCLCVLVHLHSRAEVASLLHEAVVREPDQERLRRLMNALSALGEMPPEDKLPRSMEEVISKQGERAGGQ